MAVGFRGLILSSLLYYKGNAFILKYLIFYEKITKSHPEIAFLTNAKLCVQNFLAIEIDVTRAPA